MNNPGLYFSFFTLSICTPTPILTWVFILKFKKTSGYLYSLKLGQVGTIPKLSVLVPCLFQLFLSSVLMGGNCKHCLTFTLKITALMTRTRETLCLHDRLAIKWLVERWRRHFGILLEKKFLTWSHSSCQICLRTNTLWVSFCYVTVTMQSADFTWFEVSLREKRKNLREV